MIAWFNPTVPLWVARVAAFSMVTSYPPGPELCAFSSATTNSRWSPVVTPFPARLPSSRKLCPYCVLVAIRLICSRILSISCWSALSIFWSLLPSFPACTATWRAWINARLTSSSAPSAVCIRETAISELSMAWPRPAVCARSPSDIWSAAGPSAARFILIPEESFSMVFCWALELFTTFLWALTALILWFIRKDILSSLVLRVNWYSLHVSIIKFPYNYTSLHNYRLPHHINEGTYAEEDHSVSSRIKS